jgi:hypothetical protein
MPSTSMRSAWFRYAALPLAILSNLTVGCTGEIPSGDLRNGAGAGMGTGAVGSGAGSSVGGSVGSGAAAGAGAGVASGGSSAGIGAGATSGSGSGGSSGGTSGPVARPMSLEGEPIYTRVMRLTNEQWENSVRDILRLSALPGIADSFEQPVAGTTDFTNNEHVLTVSNALWKSYQAGSETIAAQVTATDAALSAVYPGTDASGFIRTVGRRAFRRPLTAAEEASYQAIFDTGAAMTGEASTFAKGAALVIRALLQSPHFIYRTELGSAGAPLTGYEVASKLSFWLRNTTPSDALLDAAGSGQLDSAEGVAAQASSLLEDPAALSVMRDFHRQLLKFDRFSTITKIGVPNFDPSLNAEFEETSYRFFDRIFQQGLGLRDILTSTVGFVGPGTAPLYGQAPPSGFEERDLGPERPGYFTQLPYLALHAFNAEPDSIHRGVTLNLDVLCAEPGAAIPDLPPVPPLAEGETNRERITTLTSACGGECHNYYINPIGFAFENFDGMGQFRETENGKPVDTASAYPFAEGVISFADAAELMQIMANGKQAHACYSKHLASYALQRDIVEADRPLLDTMAAVSMANAGSVKQVMIELAKNPTFTTRLGGTP